MAKEKIGDVEAVLNLVTGPFDRAYKGAFTGFTRGFAGMIRFTEQNMKRVVRAITVYATTSVKAFSNFEDAMVRSAAVTTGAVGAMREEMEKAALEMSRRTILTARELAEGYFALGQAGFNAVQSIKALPVVTEFAVASQVRLDTATRYLVRTLEGLGMASEDPIRNMLQMERVSNAFTYAAIKTTAEINDFAIAMTHAAAPALRLVGKTMEEGMSVLMAFARAGIVGAEAGTLLWTTVRDLQRASIKARGEWKELGLEIYDSTGKMRNMADIFMDLEAEFKGVSDEGKKVNLMLLGFQDRSLRGVQALMGFADPMKQFEEDMANIGKLTSEISRKYLQSFQSQMKMVWNHIVEVGIAFGKKLGPAIYEVGQTIKRNQKTVKSWAEAMGEVIGIVVDKLRYFVDFLLSDWRSGVELSLEVVKSLFVAFGEYVWLFLRDVFKNIGSNIIPWLIHEPIDKMLGKLDKSLEKGFKTIGRKFDATFAELGWELPSLEGWFESYGKSLDKAGKETEKFRAKAFDWSTDQYAAVGEKLRSNIAKVYKEYNYAQHVAQEESLDRWREHGKLLGDIIVGPWKVTGKKIAMEVAKWWDPKNIRLPHAERVRIALQKLKEPLKQMHQEFRGQYETLGRTNEEMTKYHMGLSLIRLLQEEFGAFEHWYPEEMEAFTKELKAQERLLGEIIKKQKESARVWDASRQWAEDASYVWVNLGEDLARGFDSFAETFTNWMTGAEVNWKQFTASILRDWLQTIVKMQMAKMLTAILPTPGGGGFNWSRVFGTGTKEIQPGIFEGPDKGALGKVFNMGNIVPMALGGLLSQATLLPMRNRRTALVAEEGPEAVMPLTRDRQGRLGVRSEPQQAVVNTKIVNVYDREEALAALNTASGEKVILNVLRRNGVL